MFLSVCRGRARAFVCMRGDVEDVLCVFRGNIQAMEVREHMLGRNTAALLPCEVCVKDEVVDLGAGQTADA